MTTATQLWTVYRRAVMRKSTALAWAVSSLIATATGPFGTFYGMPLAERMIFWSGIIALSLAIALALKTALRVFRPDFDEWTESLVLALALTVVFTPILFAITQALSGGDAGMSLFQMSAFVVIVPLAVTAYARILRQPRLEIGPRTPEDTPRIYNRLPEDVTGQKLVRISVRDHYVEVVTDRKSETLLMRFSDAIAEAEGIPGLQVHRSHWVAEDAVAGVDKEKGRMFLKLVDGSRVPVSRGYQSAVKEAGIDDTAA